MWLNPLKGAHLTLGQLDKTLPVDMSVTKNKAIERGSIVFISTGGSATPNNSQPRFQIYTSAEAVKANAVPYVALMGVNDFQAGMAGNDVQAPTAEGIDKGTAAAGATETWLRTPPQGKDSIVGVSDIRGPRITAISLVQPAEWETTAFAQKDAEDRNIVGSYYVGMPLSVNDEGKVAPWSEGQNIVGYVTAVPHKRWINDLGASADGARISGGNALVLAYSTAWIPAAAVEHKDAVAADPEATPPVEGSAEVPGTVGKLSVPGNKPAAPAQAQAPAAPAQAPAAPAQKAPAAPADSKQATK